MALKSVSLRSKALLLTPMDWDGSFLPLYPIIFQLSIIYDLNKLRIQIRA